MISSSLSPHNLRHNITWKHPLVLIASVLFISIITLLGDVSPPNILGGRAIYAGFGIQVLAGIWFGVWGLPACFFGGFLFQILHGQTIGVAILIGSGDIFTGLVPALVFRYFRVNADLTTLKDWIALIMAGILLAPLPGASIGMTVLTLAGVIPYSSFWLGFGYWVFGAYLVVSIVSPLSLVFLSSLLQKQGFFFSNLWG